MEIVVSKKKWSFQKLVMLILMIIGPVFNLFMLLGYADLDAMAVLEMHNISVASLGSVLVLLLYVSSIKNRDEHNGMGMVFSYMLFNNSVLYFFDFVRWATNGMSQYVYQTIIFNEMYLIISLWMMDLFWHYLVEITLPDDPKLRKVTKGVNIVTIFAILTVIGNWFGRYYFTVDPSTGLMTNGKYLPCIGIYTLVLLIASWGFLATYPFPKQKKKILFSYIIFPIAATIYQLFVPNISLVPSALLCAITLIYVNIFAQRNEEAAREELEIKRKESEILTIQRDHARIDTELDMATKIQASMLPCTFPAFPNKKEFDIYASMSPAKEVGGDFYDYFMLDDDHLVLVMADVSGKGVPGALFMMASKIMIKNIYQANKVLPPSQILEIVNNMLLENNNIELFVTAWLAKYEISTGTLTYANAGHEDPAIMRNGGTYELHVTHHGFVLAGMENTHYKDMTLTLDHGDKLFIYTDGVTEATNGDEELWGSERMLQALNKYRDCASKELIEGVKKEAGIFIGDEEPFDDMTMLSLEIH